MKTIFSLFCICMLLFGGEAICQTIVKTENGSIEGSVHEGIRIFKGIPFAAPPVGEFRWRAPQPVKSWKGIKKCTAFSASPMQDIPAPFMFWSEEFLIPKEPISEDCLYLNVWTGSQAATEKRPVLVYIYGGGFRSGGSACPIYDGEAMAKKGVVFVSINYRVGVFGFLAHPELSKEASYHTSGNYALLDMIAALQWVQRNIHALGGDAKNVTIAGQSAGAFGVNHLVASPLTKNLIHKAIAQSGGNFYSSRPQLDLKKAEEMGMQFAQSLNCKSLAELRSKSSEEILKSQAGMSFPIIDGYVMPESIQAIFSKGKQNDIPTITGWNEDDRVSGPPVKIEIFKEQIQKRFGDMAAFFFKAYPVETEEQSAHSQMAYGRDEIFGFQDYTWAKLQTRTGKAKVFIYNFNRKLPANTPETQFGAFHSGEIVYAYNNLHTLHRPWEKIDYSIAEMMSSYWTNFAKTGNPNGKDLPTWNEYQANNEQVMAIDKISQSVTLHSKMQMEFWEKYFTSGQ